MKPLPLFGGDIDGEGIVEPAALLPEMTAGEEVVEDYVSMRLSLRAHPMSFLRARLTPGMGRVPTGPVAEGRRFTEARGLIRSEAWAKDDESGGLKCVSVRE